jgi:flavin reductase (DIM6/NTAB) family NADH-FMN oxidoreductase RutF
VASGDDLRAAMRRFPSGIAVVTIDDEGRKLGLTAGSLVSLSLEPPLVGISIGLDSSLHAPLRRAGRFAVNVLAGDQEALAQHFARSVPPIAQWVGIATRASGVPEPLLEGALAWLECRVVHECAAGDHTFFVSELLSVELGRPREGLVYVEGAYRRV